MTVARRGHRGAESSVCSVQGGVVSLRRSARTIAFTLGLGVLRTVVIKSIGYQVRLVKA